MYDQRDIVLVPFPYTNLSGFKKRPALIVSNSKVNYSEDRICMLITSVPLGKLGIKLEENYLEEPLIYESYLKSQRVFTVSKSKIDKKISKVTVNFFKKISHDLKIKIEFEY